VWVVWVGLLLVVFGVGLWVGVGLGWLVVLVWGFGLIVESGGRARYTGTLRRLLADVAPDLADGFEAAQVETVADRMSALRERLQAQAV
jgi:hypothetical protein